MSLNVCVALKDGTTGMMLTFEWFDSMDIGRVSKKFFAQRTLEGQTPVSAGQWLTI